MQSPGKRIRRIYIVFWAMLIYIIAALIWWFISLEKQNRQMAEMKYELLQTATLTVTEITNRKAAIEADNKRNIAKYTGEGITFLLLTLIAASFVYSAIRRQFRMQQQQQNFMMAVTHELKTPIAINNLNLEMLQKYKLDPDKQDKLIKSTLQENARLNNLTNNILLSAQMEGGKSNYQKEELNLSDLFADCLTRFETRFPDRRFISEIEQDVDIKGDPLLLQMLANNLLENAVKYSSKEKPVQCKLSKTDNKILLSIIDEGEGIPDEEKKKIFDKFYRVGNEEIRKTKGTGLGLYLCRKIASDHQANISVTDNTPDGSKFVVTFYTNK